MTDELSSIEKALTYAELTEQSEIVVNGDQEKHDKLLAYQKKLNGIPSSKLIDIQLNLESQIPYFTFCKDENIKRYFSQFDLPFASIDDLELFSYALSQELSGRGQNERRVTHLVRQRDLSKKLQGVSSRISLVDQSISNFEDLVYPIEQMLFGLYQVCLIPGFELYTDSVKLYSIVQSSNPLFNLLLNPTNIPPGSLRIRLTIWTPDEDNKYMRDHQLNYYLNPETEDIIVEEYRFRLTSIIYRWGDVKGFVKHLAKGSKKLSLENRNHLVEFFRKFFNLPNLINEEIEEEIEGLDSLRDSLVKFSHQCD